MHKQYVKIKVSDIKPCKKNPRKNEKAIPYVEKSIQDNGYITPVIIDENNEILAGHTRISALKKLNIDEIDVVKVEGLTDEQKKNYRVLDNKTTEFAEWDFDILMDGFTEEELSLLGFKPQRETEKLSGLQYESMYYEPEHKPEIILKDCINFEKFDAKLKALDEFKLTKEQKDQLKWFAYRFLKIDFENVANYYAFNASEEEKKAIERLRLVLVDSAIEGFIEDDLLRIYDYMNPIINKFEENEDDD